jgi:penicillin amidase
MQQVFDAVLAPCRAADERFDVDRFPQLEGPLWALVTERPAHLLDPARDDWDDQLLAAADAVLERFPAAPGSTLEQATWGERNRIALRHPIGPAVPWLSRWVDLPARELPGDVDMPRVQSTGFGASMRMVVAPGRETDGIFHMPGGQSGHPRSPCYAAGHEAWAGGEPARFLPGPPAHRLTLLPPA